MSAAATDRAGYAYWREHGGAWASEYDRRKEHQPLYHVQELMLATYVANAAPARVLEYGCGVGRHLQYLRELPGIDVHGYDQSPTMVEAISAWASPAWVADHVVVGQPVARLPYPDDHFDVAYTAEVLVHVHPEDLDAILRELLRVARWQILHLEPPPTFPVDRDAHAGCWAHDLCAAYERLGRRCEILPAGYAAHTPYRVVRDASRAPWTWSPVTLRLCRRLEQDLLRGLSERDARNEALEAETRRLTAACHALQEQLARATELLAMERGRATELQARAAALEQALNETAIRADDLERRLRRLRAVRQRFLHELQSVLVRER